MLDKTVVVVQTVKRFPDYTYVKLEEVPALDPSENSVQIAMDVMLEVHRLQTLKEFEHGKKYELTVRVLED